MPDLGEFLLIGIVALLVIPPERLPQVARSVGQWIGKLQGWASQARTDIERELQLADLRRIGEEARESARSVESAVHGAISGVQSDLDKARVDVAQSLGAAPWSGASWSGGGPSAPTSFPKRYRPRPTIDDLTLEIEQLKRQLAVPGSGAPGARRKFAPRSRINRPRVRR